MICNICDLKLPNRNVLKTHKELNHKSTLNDKAKWYCKTCKTHFTRAWTLKNHLKLHKGKEQKLFFCTLCTRVPEGFQNLPSYQDHILKFHQTVTEGYTGIFKSVQSALQRCFETFFAKLDDTITFQQLRLDAKVMDGMVSLLKAKIIELDTFKFAIVVTGQFVKKSLEGTYWFFIQYTRH